MNPVVLDVSQFFDQPYASGIQRVLGELAAHWPVERVPAMFAFRHGDVLGGLEPAAFAAIVGEVFACREIEGERVREQMVSQAHWWGSESEAVALAATWVLPEVTYSIDVLERFDRASAQIGGLLVFYDAFPETQPQHYGVGPGFAVVSDYFRRAVEAESVVAISDESAAVLRDRLRRPRGMPIHVAYPGGDHVMPSRTSLPETQQVAMVSTLEPRKNHAAVVDGFVRAATVEPGLRLVLAGRRHFQTVELEARIVHLQTQGFDIVRITDATDEVVRDIYRTSRAVLSLGDEGYGISVVEALGNGCPVIIGGVQPAGRICEGAGVVRLPSVTPQAVGAALLNLASDEWAANLRSSIDASRIPRWSDFASEVARVAMEKSPTSGR